MTCFYLWAMATVICSNPQPVPPNPPTPYQPPPAVYQMPDWQMMAPLAPAATVPPQPLWVPPCLGLACTTQ